MTWESRLLSDGHSDADATDMAGVLAFIGASPLRYEPREKEDTVRHKKLAATVVRLLPCLKMVTEELYG